MTGVPAYHIRTCRALRDAGLRARGRALGVGRCTERERKVEGAQKESTGRNGGVRLIHPTIKRTGVKTATRAGSKVGWETGRRTHPQGCALGWAMGLESGRLHRRAGGGRCQSSHRRQQEPPSPGCQTEIEIHRGRERMAKPTGMAFSFDLCSKPEQPASAL